MSKKRSNTTAIYNAKLPCETKDRSAKTLAKKIIIRISPGKNSKESAPSGEYHKEQKLQANEGLLQAVQHGDTVQLYDYLDKGADINTRDDLGNKLIHIAVARSDIKMAQALLQLDYRLLHSKTTGAKSTPLHVAAFKGDLEMVNFLIEQIKNQYDKKVSLLFIDDIDSFHAAAMHVAASNGHFKVIEALVNAGSDMDRQDLSGQTPAHIARDFGCPESLEILEKAGADFMIKDSCYKTPLQIKPGETGYSFIYDNYPLSSIDDLYNDDSQNQVGNLGDTDS